MTNLPSFNNLLESLKFINSLTTDYVQLFIPCNVTGNEEEILKLFYFSVAPFIRSQLPENWKLVSYGISSRYLQKITKRQGVDVMLQKDNDKLRQSCTVTRFEILADSSLKKIT
jgi:hypothetical protein